MNSKFNYQDTVLVQRVKDENIFTCGNSLFPPNHERFSKVAVNRSLSCELSTIETSYYSSKYNHAANFPEVCIHCRKNQSNLCNNDDIKEINRKYSSVRPKCNPCYAAGKLPLTRGPLNAVAAKKKKSN